MAYIIHWWKTWFIWKFQTEIWKPSKTQYITLDIKCTGCKTEVHSPSVGDAESSCENEQQDCLPLYYNMNN